MPLDKFPHGLAAMGSPPGYADRSVVALMQLARPTACICTEPLPPQAHRPWDPTEVMHRVATPPNDTQTVGAMGALPWTYRVG